MLKKYVLCVFVCVIVLFQAKRGIATVIEVIRQIVGLDPSISQHLILNSSDWSFEGCSTLCIYKGCRCFVYDSNGYCALYDTFLASDDNTVDGLFALKEKCYPRLFNMTNVALGKPVTMSTVYSLPGYESTLLVNGARDQIWPCTSTDWGWYQYVIVDLQQSYSIVGFLLLNRGNCCHERLFAVHVQVGEKLSELNDVIVHPEAMGHKCSIILTQPVHGRHVKVFIDGNSILSLCQLEVYTME